uniref:aECM cysteine-cradle domain-containing protein n=1 Tax=Meloidogyne enterolobii TaxID=390850 RepID=A0A6V7VU63_MELEN|nr:unnamed protein product [Meloidogyne enterolobii]
MMEAVRQEQLGINEPDPQLSERKKEIENRLLQLAHAERFHRAMLERQKTEQQLEKQKSTERRYPTTTEKSSVITTQTQAPSTNENNLNICERVVRFIRLFKISRPRLWIETNCKFAKKHFPNASCERIGGLLNECLMEERKRINKEKEERRENEGRREDGERREDDEESDDKKR